MYTMNGPEWEEHSSAWVAMQERSRRIKEEAEKLGKQGEERRQYAVEFYKTSKSDPKI